MGCVTFVLLFHFAWLSLAGSTAQVGPFVVNITIPVKDYDPVVFSLGKTCRKPDISDYTFAAWACPSFDLKLFAQYLCHAEYKQVTRKAGSTGWTTFGVLSFL